MDEGGAGGTGEGNKARFLGGTELIEYCNRDLEKGYFGVCARCVRLNAST